MTIGYVTVLEADNYIESRYASTNPDRLRWDALTDEDKAVYLTQSVDAIDLLPFLYRKTDVTQVHAFPRKGSTVVPAAVKHAQVENALKLSKDLDTSDYEDMELRGVKSYSIGDLSETLSTGIKTPAGIATTKVLQLLRPYLSGGYRI